MTPATFLKAFPLFRETDASLVEAKIAEASAWMGGPDASVWGAFAPIAPAGQLQTQTIADAAQGNLAAHLIITDPFGTSTNLKADGNGRTVYLEKFEELMLRVGGGVVVAGILV